MSALGHRHWLWQRASAVLLVPLVIGYLWALWRIPDFEYRTVVAWAQSPICALLLAVFVASLLLHSWWGVQVVVEDYLRGPARTALLATSTLVHAAAALASFWALYRLTGHH
jgi:succinate dehydrogenase / fumarate reductase, membrane anchor subunit